MPIFFKKALLKVLKQLNPELRATSSIFFSPCENKYKD